MDNYINNAGAGKMSSETMNVISDYYKLERDIGGYEAQTQTISAQEQFYENVAKLINASKEEIAYVDSGSRAWNLIIQGINFQHGETILTLSSEYGTNLLTLLQIRDKCGCNLIILKCDIEGRPHEDELKKVDSAKVDYIFVSHAAAQGSIVNDLERLKILAKEKEALFVVDGTQSIGQIPVDVNKIGCDALTANGRKWLRGPRGTGFLYVKKGSRIKGTHLNPTNAHIKVNDDRLKLEIEDNAKKFELWERNISAMLGLSSAIRAYLNNDPEQIHTTIVKNATFIRKQIAKNENLLLIGGEDSETGIIGFISKTKEHESRVRQTFMPFLGYAIPEIPNSAFPLHLDGNRDRAVFRISAHYDASPSFVRELAGVIACS